MKQWLLIISLIVLVTLSACGGNGDNGNEENETNESTDGQTVENNESASSSEVLSLGETGTVEDTLGTYQVTAHTFEIIESYEENIPWNDEYVIVDITIENIGESTLNGQDITKPALFVDGDLRFDVRSDLEFVDRIRGEIEPGDEVTGQLVFDPSESDSYRLIFGYALSSVSNEITWEFTRDEAE